MQNWEDGSQGGLNCTAVNKETKKVVQFELEMDDDVEEGEEAEWDYTPGAHADLLPEYLREEISFPLSAAPKFVTRLVDALCEDTKKWMIWGNMTMTRWQMTNWQIWGGQT